MPALRQMYSVIFMEKEPRQAHIPCWYQIIRDSHEGALERLSFQHHRVLVPLQESGSGMIALVIVRHGF